MSLLLQIVTGAADTAAAIQTTAATTATAPPPSMNPATEVHMPVWELVVKGGPVMIPIALCSIVAIYLIVERYLSIRKSAKIDPNFMNSIRDFIGSGNVDAAKALCRNTKGPIARMIEKGINRLGKPTREIENSIESAGKLEVYNMERNLGYLSTIAGIAPMFGFLGTIFGVIQIFYQISLQNSLEIGTISGGLYVKMITSGAGLLVGMVAYAGFHFLTQYVDRVINKMEITAVEFIDLLEEPTKWNIRRRLKSHTDVYSHSLNDIMFFLLLFFLIASTMATPSVLKLLLPNAQTGIQAVKHPVVISLTADRQFAVNQTIVSKDQLEQTLLAEINGQQDPTALLKVDKSVPWEDVVFLLDVGNKNKVKMVAATSLTKYQEP